MDSRLMFRRTRTCCTSRVRTRSVNRTRLEVNQLTDSTKEEFESTYLGYSPYWDDTSTMVASRIFQVIGIGLRAVSNTCEEPGPVRFLLGSQYD